MVFNEDAGEAGPAIDSVRHMERRKTLIREE